MQNTAGASDVDITPEGRMEGDRPRERLGEDRLGYANFARAVAKAVISMAPRDGTVLAIHGPWGSGKTSAVNMIVDAVDEAQASVDETERLIVVRFNPWWFSEQGDLARAFFTEVSAALGAKVSNDVREGLKKVAKRVSGTKDLVLAALSLLPAGDAAKSALGGLIELAGGAISGERSLDEERTELQAALRKQNKKILVIIDDVDRLPADEARQIFRLVKSVADLPYVIYLLVFDRAIAARALEQPSDPDGPEWLEKIVQASFDLPPIHPVDLHRMFFEGLSRVANGTSLSDPTRWGNVFHDCVSPWLRTPRDVTRLLNALAVSLPPVCDDVDFADFVAIETLRMFEPRLHNLIKTRPDELTGLARDHVQQRRKDIGDRLEACVEEGKRPVLRRALERLFPKLESVWGNHGYANEFLNKWNAERRICAPNRFPAYFIFGIGEEALSKRDMDRVRCSLQDPAEFTTIVQEAAGRPRRAGGTRAAVLLDEIGALASDMEPDALERAATSILFAADGFLTAADDAGGFSLPVVWQISWAVDAFLGKLEVSAQARILRDALSTSPSLSSLSFLVFGWSREHGRHAEEPPKDESERRFDEQTVIFFETALASRLAAAAADGTLIASKQALDLIYAWSELAGNELVKQWSDGQIATDEGALNLARMVTTKGHVIGSGDRVAREYPAVNREALTPLIDLERLDTRLNEIDTDSTPSVLHIIQQFRRGLRGRNWRDN